MLQLIAIRGRLQPSSRDSERRKKSMWFRVR